MDRKNILKILLGTGISILFIFLALRKVNFPELGEAFKTANYFYLIPVCALTFLAFYLRAFRWRYLLLPVKDLSPNYLFPPLMIGFMGNYLLPARAGEFIRAYVAGEKAKIPKSAAFATIVFERVLDGLTLLLIGLVVLFIHPFPGKFARMGITALAIYLAVLFLLLLLLYVPGFFEKFLVILPEKAREKGKRFIQSFSSGLEVMRNPRLLFPSFLYSLAVWGITGFFLYVLFFAYDLKLPLHAAYLTTVIFTIGIMIPSSPGFIGTFHYFVWLGLAVFGVKKEVALSYATLLHFSQFIVVVITGLVFLYTEGISFGKIKEIRDEG
ncbi:UPF0104 family protein [bacterium]|nr:MAG: UPF0104 family protein [bacterium]